MCQSTVAENADGIVAAVAPILVDVSELMVNDGTNACVFLCLKLPHELLSKDLLTSSFKIAQLAKDIIKKLPPEN